LITRWTTWNYLRKTNYPPLPSMSSPFSLAQVEPSPQIPSRPHLTPATLLVKIARSPPLLARRRTGATEHTPLMSPPQEALEFAMNRAKSSDLSPILYRFHRLFVQKSPGRFKLVKCHFKKNNLFEFRMTIN
jgi:hypothetical protein